MLSLSVGHSDISLITVTIQISICMVTMHSLSIDLSLGAQTSYAELLDIARSVEATRFGTLRGSFHRRKIKGKTYLYFNFRDIDGGGRSVYVGPESARVQRLVDEFEQGAVVRQRLTALSQRAQACIALGCDSIPTKHFRAVQKLAGRGLFRAGGVLVGTQAFVMMGNMLGLRWEGRGKAMDLGFTHAEPSISIALPADFEVSHCDAITSLEAGLLPIRELSDLASKKSIDLGMPELRIQLIAPVVDHSGELQTRSLGIDQELPMFTELLLDDAVQGVAFAKPGACLVNLPDPARLAVHNLLVYGEMSIRGQTMAIKHLLQSAALIEWHIDQQRITHLRDVWRNAVSRGTSWRESGKNGRRALSDMHPLLARAFE
jgi:hypothetical protein